MGVLPRLRVVTCDQRARSDRQFGELERLCGEKGVELYVDETPFWVVSGPRKVSEPGIVAED